MGLITTALCILGIVWLVQTIINLIRAFRNMQEITPKITQESTI